MLGATRRELLSVAALLTGLALIGWQVITGGALVHLDITVRHYLLAAQVTPVRWLGLAITYLGFAPLAVPIFVAVAATISRARGSSEPLVTAVLGALGLVLTVLTLKALVARPATDGRPPSVLSGAWPSGHTTTVTVVYLLLAAMVRDEPGPAPPYAAAVLRCVPVFVGLSLLYCDYHWLSDVIAGYLLGGAIVISAQVLARRFPPDSRLPLARRTASQNRA